MLENRNQNEKEELEKKNTEKVPMSASSDAEEGSRTEGFGKQAEEYKKELIGDSILEPGGKSTGFLLFIWETLKVVIICLIIIIPVRKFLFQPFYVKGASMEPNFHDNEYLIINEITYRFNDPVRGDIVVFDHEGSYFIKRVIALPGEEIEIKNEEVIIYNQEHPDGFVLDESAYLPASARTIETIERLEVSVGEYFVMGDNRMSSLDSRRFGTVSRDLIVGRTWLRGFPFDKFTVFDTPDYND